MKGAVMDFFKSENPFLINLAAIVAILAAFCAAIVKFLEWLKSAKLKRITAAIEVRLRTQPEYLVKLTNNTSQPILISLVEAPLGIRVLDLI